jgi:hypothetical protein
MWGPCSHIRAQPQVADGRDNLHKSKAEEFYLLEYNSM